MLQLLPLLMQGCGHGRQSPPVVRWRIRLGAGSSRLKLRRPIQGQPAAFDDRSRAEIDLSHVETAIRTLAQGGMVQEYSIGSRNLKRFRMAELLQLRDELKNEIAMERKRERIRQGLGNPGLAKVRFT
jgi:hypothetical protein